MWGQTKQLGCERGRQLGWSVGYVWEGSQAGPPSRRPRMAADCSVGHSRGEAGQSGGLCTDLVVTLGVGQRGE